ncbi:hypothetical protein AVEN_96812-1 [Araneus ventricosus]|uniref:Uncharacterized protein n=1 Tax=Araneus ventricosus TaxID=182803 RepID=A0A4Y2M8Z4_ARAVE|nr:hypothetical protein AVEN_96812-1 [Araneus ventricosus]
MDEFSAVFSIQAGMPASSPLKRSDTQDGLASELADSKQVTTRKLATAHKVSGKKASGLKMPNPNDKNIETVDNSSNTENTLAEAVEQYTNTDVLMENANLSDPHIIPFDSENGMKM